MRREEVPTLTVKTYVVLLHATWPLDPKTLSATESPPLVFGQT